MNYALHSAFPLLACVALTSAAIAQDPAAAAPASGPAHKLAVQAKAGAKASFRNENIQKQLIAAMGRETETKLTTDYDVEVVSAGADGNTKVKLTWRRISGSLSSPMGGGVEFDSAAKDPGGDDPMLGGVIDAFLGMVGKSVELTVGADGEVTDKKPVTKLIESLTEGVDGMGRMMVQGLLSDTSIAGQAEVFGKYPTEPVAVGGTWKHENKMGGRGGMKMKSDVVVKLTALDADTCRMSVEGAIAIDKSKTAAASTDGGDDPQAEMMRKMMEDATIENGKVKGEAVVSRKDGMLQSSSNATSMDIAMPNPMGGDEPFIVKVEQTTKVSRREATADTKNAHPGK